jgi:hypothetical protein
MSGNATKPASDTSPLPSRPNAGDRPTKKPERPCPENRVNIKHQLGVRIGTMHRWNKPSSSSTETSGLQ